MDWDLIDIPIPHSLKKSKLDEGQKWKGKVTTEVVRDQIRHCTYNSRMAKDEERVNAAKIKARERKLKMLEERKQAGKDAKERSDHKSKKSEKGHAQKDQSLKNDSKCEKSKREKSKNDESTGEESKEEPDKNSHGGSQKRSQQGTSQTHHPRKENAKQDNSKKEESTEEESIKEVESSHEGEEEKAFQDNANASDDENEMHTGDGEINLNATLNSVYSDDAFD